MNTIDDRIAINLRKIRKSKNMSLELLAKKTGVSKSMLGQIERGESNPTVATIGKIVDGLKITYEELLYEKEADVIQIDAEVMRPSREVKGKYIIKQIFPFERKRRFELLYIQIEPGQVCGKISDTEGTCEYATVLEGELLVRIGSKEHTLKVNQSMRLVSDQEHCYCNKGTEPLKMNLILSYEMYPMEG